MKVRSVKTKSIMPTIQGDCTVILVNFTEKHVQIRSNKSTGCFKKDLQKSTLISQKTYCKRFVRQLEQTINILNQKPKTRSLGFQY